MSESFQLIALEDNTESTIRDQAIDVSCAELQATPLMIMKATMHHDLDHLGATRLTTVPSALRG
jgi:hypothetical protein